MTGSSVTNPKVGLLPVWSRCRASWAFALVMLWCVRVDAACKAADVDQMRGDRIAYEADDLRKNLETFALSDTSRKPVDTLGARLAWDETEQAISDYSALKTLSKLSAQMKTATDRTAVDAAFAEMAGTTAHALKNVTDYLTVFSTKAVDPSIALQVAKMRDELRELAKLFQCADAD
jgi:hypothetical protein